MTAPFLDVADLKRQHAAFVRSHTIAVNVSAEEAASVAQGVAIKKAGFQKRTGKTHKKTKPRVIRRGGKTLIIGVKNTAKHAAVLEKGSKAHVIRARRRKALRFMAGGKLVFRKAVNHPGTKPYRFLSRGRDAGSAAFAKQMTARMRRIASRF